MIHRLYISGDNTVTPPLITKNIADYHPFITGWYGMRDGKASERKSHGKMQGVITAEIRVSNGEMLP